MRLIDADAWIEELNQIISDEENPKGAKEWAVGMIAAITVRPTAYDVDKVVEQLEDMRSKREEQLRICADKDMEDYLRCKMSAIAEIIEVVKSGGIE